jgi:hypothetical protein
MPLNRVVLPHPDGPINEVTRFSFTSRLIFFKANLPVNQALSDWTDNFGFSILNSEVNFTSGLGWVKVLVDSFLGSELMEDN